MPRGQPGTKAPHGTLSRYTIHSCRCRICKDALRDYQRAKRGSRPREVVDAERAAKHGTESKYTGGCRCAPCVAAASRARKRRRIENGPSPHALHGKNSTYADGCRCDECRVAHTVYSRELYARKRMAA